MKKVLATLIALSVLGLGSMALAQDKSEPGTATSIKVKPIEAKPVLIKPKPFPPHWGKPPAIQTRDLRPLPGGFGMGSSTLAKWIEENLKADSEKKEKPDTGGPDPKPKPEKGKFGLWLGEDGFIIPGPKTADFIDSDRDGIDDRVQPKPGAPAAKPRPEKPGGGEKPGEKPGGGEKPGEKPGGQLGGGGKPKPPAPFRPKQPRPELPDALQIQVDAFEAGQKALRDALKTKIDALGDDATREDVKAAAEAFKADNKDAIEAQMAAGKALHEAIKENRPEHEKVDRPEPPAAVKEKADAVRGFHQQLGKARHDLHKALKDASEEDRAAMIAAFKAAQKEHHQELKEAKKALREAIRDNAQSGDRRTDD